ncbi:MAG TPA: NAD-dependent epimerase/dehydratase family protein [Patescibacteria group bacterium]|nr:NAD-dependent epimerase/dehydratase family protein [Patescibacteria group bacterium]
MNILVTGGAGFLGSHLCRSLAGAGHSVRVLDHNKNPEFETVVGDVGDSEMVANTLRDVSVVFHLASHIEAGESVEKPYEYTRNNVLGTVVLLEEMRKANITRFIFSSSAAIYGEPIRVPIFEDDRTMPINPYGMTKLAMEALASSYAYAHKFSCVALRYFNLYGPGENHIPETHAIPRFISQIKEGGEVTVWGNGEHKRDFVYIGDIVDAHVKALRLEDPGYYYMNLSGKNATSVAEVITMIEGILGKKANIVHNPNRPGDPLLLFADGTKAKDLLGWEATTTLDAGLKKTIDSLYA